MLRVGLVAEGKMFKRVIRGLGKLATCTRRTDTRLEKQMGTKFQQLNCNIRGPLECTPEILDVNDQSSMC